MSISRLPLDSFSIILPEAGSIEKMNEELNMTGGGGTDIRLRDPDGIMIIIGL